MRYTKGTPKNPRSGRKKGVPNKNTQSVKEAIEMAFNNNGGVQGLSDWVKDNKTIFYSQVWPKILPKDINVKGAITLEQLICGDKDEKDKD